MLTLVLLAAVITGGAYTLVSLGRNATLPANIGPFLALMFALLLTPHMANRFFAKGADSVLLPLAALLNGVGYVFIARVKPSLASKQSGWTIIGVAAYGLVVVPMGGFSTLAGSIALSMIMLPTIARSTEEVVRLVIRTHARPGAAVGTARAIRTISFGSSPITMRSRSLGLIVFRMP